MIKYKFLILLLVGLRAVCLANEGMWLPIFLSQLNEKEMRSMGMKLRAKDIWNINKGSLKDAIVQFGGGCTGEIISPEGLLLTNHHCGFGQIQSHSSVSHNYVEDGFWAASRAQELPNPGLTATFIVNIVEVTNTVLEGIPATASVAARQTQVEQRIALLQKNYPREAWQAVQVKPFFKGNQYYLFVTETFEDVRLVGAPPDAIGNFGVDTDNWVYPRHTADFSLFRIYADANNRPAPYHKNNVPYKPKHFLPISMKGIKEDDFTMVFGFPGVTNEYLSNYGVAQVMHTIDPVRVGIRDISLGIMREEMRNSTANKIKYVAKYAGIANGWKKWRGEMEGLRRTHAIEKKKTYEADFTQRLQRNPTLQSKYGNLLGELETLHKKADVYAGTREYFNELLRVNIELFRLTARADALVEAAEKGDNEAFNKKIADFQQDLPTFFKNYEPAIDQRVFAALFEHFAKNVATTYHPEALSTALAKHGEAAAWSKHLYATTMLTSLTQWQQLLQFPAGKIVGSIKADEAYQLYKSMTTTQNTLVTQPLQQLEPRINELNSLYMQAQMEAFPEKKFYPDANSTLRITYGKVKGYQPRDAVYYQHQTYLDGVMEKYIPEDYEFDVPLKLRELYAQKDYGRYGENGRLPVCFIGSNHTTGGNSGSPAIDAKGNLIGLNFDRVWEGTMSDLNYDSSICRNIMVDIRYVLFIIDKYAGAGHLIKEMKLVTR